MASKRTCPRCGAERAAEIILGMPAFDDDFQRAMKNGDIQGGFYRGW